MLHSLRMGPKKEVQRAPRLTATFWVHIEGVDKQPVLRPGNISNSGLLFDGRFDTQVGALELLHIASRDKLHQVTIMARVVRVDRSFEGALNPRNAVAFKFLPDGPNKRTQLDALVQYMNATGEAQDVQWADLLEVTINDASKRRVPPADLTVARVEFETSQSICLGEKIQLVIPSQDDGAPVFEGYVSKVTDAETKGRYYISVTPITEDPSDARQESITQSNNIITPDDLPIDYDALGHAARHLLTGHLDRIALPSLLTWFEMERMTGELVIEGNERTIFLYLREGAILDIEREAVEDAGACDLESMIGRLFEQTQGQFRFYEKPIERPDRVGVSTTGLLLEHMRQSDEAAQDLVL